MGSMFIFSSSLGKGSKIKLIMFAEFSAKGYNRLDRTINGFENAASWLEIFTNLSNEKKLNKLGPSCAKLSTAELATNWLGASYQLAGS